MLREGDASARLWTNAGQITIYPLRLGTLQIHGVACQHLNYSRSSGACVLQPPFPRRPLGVMNRRNTNPVNFKVIFVTTQNELALLVVCDTDITNSPSISIAVMVRLVICGVYYYIHVCVVILMKVDIVLPIGPTVYFPVDLRKACSIYLDDKLC